MERIKTILGSKRRPTFHRMDSAARRWQVVVEKPTYDLTVWVHNREEPAAVSGTGLRQCRTRLMAVRPDDLMPRLAR